MAPNDVVGVLDWNSKYKPQEAMTVDAQVNTCDNVAAVSLRGPYLQIFSSTDGCFEFDLVTPRTTIGRSDESDIKFDDSMVSRKHAVITHENDKFLVKDLGSYQGTKVNGRTIHRHPLQHGDGIQIATHVLQFKAYTAETIGRRASARAKRLLHGDFHLLPLSMELKYRLLASGSENIFASGDTLVVGRGGLLVPAQDVAEDAVCVELSLTWPDRREKRLLGEILGVIADEGMNWMCVKIHRASKETHAILTKPGTPGEWIPVRM